MSWAKSTYLAKKTVNHNCGLVAYTRPNPVWIGLASATLNADSDFTDEISTSGTGYGRLNFTAAAQVADDDPLNRVLLNSILTFGNPTANYTVVSGFLADAETGGNMLYFGAFRFSRQILSGGAPFILMPGTVSIQEG